MKSTCFTLFALVVCLALTCGNAQRRRCQTVCPLNYRPVCALSKFGTFKTFSNKCQLDAHNCRNPADKYGWVSNKSCV